MKKSRRKDLRRREPVREIRKRYLIVCEGRITEAQYLDGINRFWQRPAALIFKHKFSSPREIVQHAVQLKTESNRKSKTDPLWEFDSIWCFFDCDNHPNILDALIQARDNDINVVFSDPTSGDTSKPAIKGHFKTGHFAAARVTKFIPCREDLRQ